MTRRSDKVQEAKPVRLWIERYRFFGLFCGNGDWRLCLGRLRLCFPRTSNLEWDHPFNALSSVDFYPLLSAIVRRDGSTHQYRERCGAIRFAKLPADRHSPRDARE